MRWYWWIVFGILAINALVIVVIALFLLWDRYRVKKARSAEGVTTSNSETEGLGR
jgi:uncharacterized membrane protein